MYDEYISLGGRCETAFQFRRVLGRDSSSFFSWNVTPLPSLIRLLETDFAGILQPETLAPNEWLVYDQSADYSFHLHGEGRKSKEHPDFLNNLAQFKEKADYLIQKLRDDARSGKRIAYFYRAEENYDLKPQAERVRDLLAALHGGINFTLIFVQEESRRTPDWNIEGVRNRYLTRFAPFNDQGDAHLLSWDKIFREFPHKEPLNFCAWIY
jgi:hypothetical protein